MIAWLADALRAEGLDVREVPGWPTRGRAARYDGTEGVMFHHTASSRTGGAVPSLRIVTEGRADLPGPLCHVLVGRDGSAWVIAAGYANHGGLGGPWKSVPLNSANRYMVGVEVENNGIGEPWSREVLAACDRVFAAVLRHQGRDASWCGGHKEYAPGRKINPAGVDMPAYRRRLARHMEGGDVASKDVLEAFGVRRPEQLRDSVMFTLGQLDRRNGRKLEEIDESNRARRRGWESEDDLVVMRSSIKP
jgi:hypothetical protein